MKRVADADLLWLDRVQMAVGRPRAEPAHSLALCAELTRRLLARRSLTEVFLDDVAAVAHLLGELGRRRGVADVAAAGNGQGAMLVGLA